MVQVSMFQDIEKAGVITEGTLTSALNISTDNAMGAFLSGIEDETLKRCATQ